MAQGNWHTDRKATLPADWNRRRAIVASRAHHQCQNTRPDGTRCPNTGTDCDHIGDRLNHALDNLQWLCPTCHDTKTAQQAADGVRAMIAKLTHPNNKRLPPGLR